MNPTQPPNIAQLPTAPFVGDPSFDASADGLLSALEPMRQQINASNGSTYSNALICLSSADSASKDANTATIAALAAAAAAGANKWQAGNYAEGAVVWSPANGLMYRRRAAGNSATEPSADNAGWWLIGSPLAAPIVVIGGNQAAQIGVHYIFTAALTLTLPAAPALRDVVQFTDLSGTQACYINPNGALARGDAGSLLLDVPNACASLTYSGPQKGWV